MELRIFSRGFFDSIQVLQVLHLGLIPCFFSQKERYQYLDITKREKTHSHPVDQKEN